MFNQKNRASIDFDENMRKFECFYFSFFNVIERKIDKIESGIRSFLVYEFSANNNFKSLQNISKLVGKWIKERRPPYLMYPLKYNYSKYSYTGKDCFKGEDKETVEYFEKINENLEEKLTTIIGEVSLLNYNNFDSDSSSEKVRYYHNKFTDTYDFEGNSYTFSRDSVDSDHLIFDRIEFKSKEFWHSVSENYNKKQLYFLIFFPRRIEFDLSMKNNLRECVEKFISSKKNLLWNPYDHVLSPKPIRNQIMAFLLSLKVRRFKIAKYLLFDILQKCFPSNHTLKIAQTVRNCDEKTITSFIEFISKNNQIQPVEEFLSSQNYQFIPNVYLSILSYLNWDHIISKVIDSLGLHFIRHNERYFEFLSQVIKAHGVKKSTPLIDFTLNKLVSISGHSGIRNIEFVSKYSHDKNYLKKYVKSIIHKEADLIYIAEEIKLHFNGETKNFLLEELLKNSGDCKLFNFIPFVAKYFPLQFDKIVRDIYKKDKNNLILIVQVIKSIPFETLLNFECVTEMIDLKIKKLENYIKSKPEPKKLKEKDIPKYEIDLTNREDINEFLRNGKESVRVFDCFSSVNEARPLAKLLAPFARCEVSGRGKYTLLTMTKKIAEYEGQLEKYKSEINHLQVDIDIEKQFLNFFHSSKFIVDKKRKNCEKPESKKKIKPNKEEEDN